MAQIIGLGPGLSRAGAIPWWPGLSDQNPRQSGGSKYCIIDANLPLEEGAPGEVSVAVAGFLCVQWRTAFLEVTMSRGMGVLQLLVKEALAFLWRKNAPTRFNEINMYVVAHHYDGPADMWFERAVRRALDGLIRRGEVVVVGGGYSSKYPRSYLVVEDFAELANTRIRHPVHAKETVRDTAHAKQIAAECFNNAKTARMVPMMVDDARQEAARRSRRRARAAR
jgi:hypothetical protein